MSDLVQRLRTGSVLSYPSEGAIREVPQLPDPIRLEAADRIEALEAENQLMRGALADIACSRDMTLEMAQEKANRVYGSLKDTP